jgi:cytochrome c
MNNMEFNKIFAAILAAGIIAMFSGFVADKLVHPHDLKEDAVQVDGGEIASAGGPKKAATAEPILALLADADIERGKKLSKACAACHTFDNGGPNGVGPNLYNIVNIQKQHHKGFSYSGVLNTNGGDVWTYAELNHFLWKPKKYAPGTKMTFAGLKKPEDRAAIIAWLRTLSASPAAMPSAAQIAAEAPEEAVEEATDAAPTDAEMDTPAEH